MMMASRRSTGDLLLTLSAITALLSPALSSRFIFLPTDHRPITAPPLADGLAFDLYSDTCPQLETIVRSAVEAALQQEIALTAGLLRIFFHDCFPQGCDASLLLTGANSEQQLPPNLTLQPRALQLIEDIRAKVHAACGPTVSCADITALATRDAVVTSGGLPYDVPLGRLDSLAPASSDAVFQLPQPTSDVTTLLNSFQSRNLDNVDLVALSGGHSIGRARCSSFSNRFREDNDFARRLAANCSTNGTRLQELDVTTPDVFDNKYYSNLVAGEGVFTSDQGLTGDWRTSWVVNGFAGNHWWFYGQFGSSMMKLGQLQGPSGEIRRNSCFVPNNNQTMTILAAAAGDDGFTVSA